jgi:hypothetical protein
MKATEPIQKPILTSIMPFPIRTDVSSRYDDGFSKHIVTGYDVEFAIATARFQFLGSCRFKSEELTKEEIEKKVLEALKEDLGIEIQPLLK